MYDNLRTAMRRESVSIEDIADTLSMHRNSANNKLNGTSKWTYDEVLLIQKAHFTHYDQCWLFKKFHKECEI